MKVSLLLLAVLKPIKSQIKSEPIICPIKNKALSESLFLERAFSYEFFKIFQNDMPFYQVYLCQEIEL